MNHTAIPSLANQFHENSNPFRWNRPVKGSREAKRIEEPVILWKKEYETNQTAFFDKIRNISDYMLLNGNTLYNFDNDNQPYLIDAVKGKLNQKEYHTAENTYGERGAIPIRDNHFYYASKSHLLGEVTSHPFKFSSKNVSNQFSHDMIKKRSKTGAKLVTNLFAEFLGEQGVDIGFAKDPKVNMTGSKKEIFDRLNEHEKMENIIYKLLQDINYRHNFLELSRDAFDTKFDVNAEFAMIEVINGDVRFKHLQPHQVSWIASKRVKTLEDDAVIAASAIDYLSFTEIMNKYGMQLNTGTGARGILDAMERIREGGMGLGNYDPDRNYFSEYFHRANRSTSDMYENDPTYQPVTWSRFNYMNSCFYPFQKTVDALNYSVLEQKNYFKMIVPTRYVVEFDGKQINKTNWEKWLKNDYSRDLIPSFTELGIDEKAPKGAFVVDKPKSELWEATRLGHGTLINVGRYEYTPERKGRGSYVGLPIVAQISYDKSFALVGYTFAYLTNIMFNRVEEITIGIGLSSALLIDTASGLDPMSFMYNARRSGVALYNSSKMNGASQAASKHLDILKLGNNIEEVQNIMAMIGMMKMLYENMIGSSPQAQGVAQKYSGAKETQLNIANQSLLKQMKFWEHSLFMNQVLQRCADVAKFVFAREDIINVTLSNGEKELLRLSPDLILADFDIFLESGIDLANKKNKIDQAVTSVLASGGIDMIEPLINILITDNPNEAMAIFRENKERIGVMMAKQQEAQQAAQQQAAQFEAQKMQVPIAVQETRNQGMIEVKRMDMQERASSEDHKGNLSDIKYNQQMEEKFVNHDLIMDQETHKASLQERIAQEFERQPER
ncbi:hypothetical protein [Dyadobacter sp. CY312]|uniref:hypothetical protein n=1 Tax=Dyadobacter sp. CY312 TaxID=2907303 RepID=UPI001F47956E|nr:hypothetical protein [Dyadobacter sp. CY312]MCE7039227.1 hypothetical protein [Dyadobacter sp. CY312]